MDKGFNDDELADIMNEIESLEKEFADEVVQADSVQDEPEKDVMESKIDVPVEEDESNVEELTASVEDKKDNVEEQKDIVDNLSEPHGEAELEHDEKLESNIEMQAEAVSEPSTDFIDSDVNDAFDDEDQHSIDHEEIEASHTHSHDNVHEFKNIKNVSEAKKEFSGTSKSSMNFSVEGDMHLNLSFNISGKTVNLNINEDSFDIELQDGMKFSIPISDSHKFDKSA